MPVDVKTIAVTKQPSSYQEMLNYLMPTKATGGQTFVPRITLKDG
jgi:hypothetical protein